MKHIVLISCGKRKLGHDAPAQILYTGTLFKLSLAYARRLQPDEIYILSAKYGLLALDDRIAPYDCTLNRLDRTARMTWGQGVILQLRRVCDTTSDRFTILAGQRYCEPLLADLANHHLPLAGLGQGQRLAFLKKILESPS